MSITDLPSYPAGEMCFPDLTAERTVVISQPVQIDSQIGRLVSIKCGYQLPEYKAWSDVTLTIVSGQCRIDFGERPVSFSAGQSIELVAHQTHQVTAVTDLRMSVVFRDSANINAPKSQNNS